MQPDPDLLQRVQPDKRLMNGKISPPYSKEMTRTSSKTQKQLQTNQNATSVKSR